MCVWGGVQICEGGSKSASGYRPGGPNPLADLDRGVQIRGGSKSAVTPASCEIFCLANHVRLFVSAPLPALS